MAKASKNKSQKIKRKDNSEDRLRYILAYLRTGKELDINTVDEEGRPIGLWAIDLRCRINGGKQIDENLRKELDEFSFFERKNLSLDAHIERAIEWIKKYPKARFSTNFNKEILREYASSDEEFELLCADYDKANWSYTYLKARNAKGKLSPDEYERLCKACVGNAFGYLDLSKKYGIQLRTVEYIMKKFGTMEAFYDAYKSGNVTYKFDINLARKAFIDIIDIDGRNDKGYDDLFRSWLKRNKLPRCGIYSSLGLEMATDEILETWRQHSNDINMKENSNDENKENLTNSQKTIYMRFGLEGFEALSFYKIAEELDTSPQRATEVVYKLFRQLFKLPEMRSKFDFNIDESLLRHEALMPQEKKRLKKIAEMIKNIGLRNVDRNSPEVITELEFLREIKSMIVEMGENSKNTGKKGSNNRVLAPKPKKEPERESSNDSKSSIDENTNAKRDAELAFIDFLYRLIDKKNCILDDLRTSGRDDNSHAKGIEEVGEELIREVSIAGKSSRLPRKNISINEKVKRIIKYLNTGEKIDGKTIDDEGYPIGQWLIYIRYGLNSGIVKLNDEHIAALNGFNVLERQIKTLDDNVKAAIAFLKKYPKVRYSSRFDYNILRQYVTPENSFEELCRDYDKAYQAFDYVMHRNVFDKLTPEQLHDLKEAKVGPRFGYPDSIEKLAKQYGVKPQTILDIIDEFGSIDNFYNEYKCGNIDKKSKFFKLAEKMIISIIDIDGKNDAAYDNLYRDIISKADPPLVVGTYSSENLKRVIENLQERIKKPSAPNGRKEKSQRREVIELKYGLNGVKKLTYEQIAERMGFSHQNAAGIVSHILSYLATPEIRGKYEYSVSRLKDSKELILYLKKLEEIESIIESIRLRNLDLHSPEVLEAFKYLKEKNNLLAEMEEENNLPQTRRMETKSDSSASGNMDIISGPKGIAIETVIYLFKEIAEKCGKIDELNASSRRKTNSGATIKKIMEKNPDRFM